MQRFMRASACAALGFGLIGVQPALADLTANIGVTNNYIWRGVTQTDDEAAVSGGLDFASESGFYVGTWASNVDFGETGTEVDLYGGFAGETDGGFGYDLGFIHYLYPELDDSDFTEVYVSGSIGGFSVTANYQVDADFTDENWIYLNAAYEVALNDDYSLSFDVGNYNTQDDIAFGDDDNYTHFGVNLSKGEFTLGLAKNNIDSDGPGKDADDVRVVVSWGREF